jgi:hypothetical protein
MSEYIRRADAVDVVAFGITIVSAFNSETGERIDLFVKENDELRKAIKRIHDLPSADVVQVVRCKDCAWCEYDTALDQYWCTRGRLIIGWHVMPDDFCSYGERKE